MRRAWIAAFALLSVLSLAGCGPDPGELEPGLKLALRDLAKAVVVNDKEKIQSYILVTAGQRGNPVGAHDAETAEGREKLYEANRRWIRKLFKDSGIVEDKDIETFMGAIKYSITNKDAWVNYEIAAEQRRAAEVVTFRMTLTDKGWRMWEYSREMKGMR